MMISTTTILHQTAQEAQSAIAWVSLPIVGRAIASGRLATAPLTRSAHASRPLPAGEKCSSLLLARRNSQSPEMFSRRAAHTVYLSPGGKRSAPGEGHQCHMRLPSAHKRAALRDRAL